MVKQLTVFIENKPGSLHKVTEILGKNNINTVTFSLADTTDFGLLRMIVSDPERARECLKGELISTHLNDVIVVQTDRTSESMFKLVSACKDYNIQYMYVWSSRGEATGVVLKVTEGEEAEKLLKDLGFKVLNEKEAYLL
ncbi:hypothetical protein [Anaerosphaera multitolerans]|uniref:ACT domain-containing protein n=1 Tax=Anaerosphaera multitolerans TaxID=2487351 RepID=A0A437S5H9_9FIRM|nr:hypothetical protein [Anaerosphaera multitolerans]RVU54227.1 hypothetical protein EF514_08595 [Anaerosphaera multitolerans]